MINHDQLRTLIIRPALDKLQLYSQQAVELLVFTCAVESNGGTYLKQINGSALGIYQMEPDTYADIWQNFIRYRSNISQLMGIHFDAYRMPEANRLVFDLRFATAMARIHYRRVSMELPSHNDPNAIWDYYKEFYNTKEGKAEKKKALKAYYNFIGQKEQAQHLPESEQTSQPS